MTRYFKTLRMMIEGLLSFLSSNSGMYNTYQPMVDSVTDLTTDAGKIDAAEMAQQINISGYTTVKRNKRKAMALKGNAIRKKVQGAASVKKDDVLYKKMSITFSKMMYGNSNTSKLLAQSIYETANGMSAADKTLYHISDAELAAFLLSINEYSAVLAAPRSAISQRKSVTESIPTLFTNAMETIETRMDKFVANYVDLPFYSEYFAHRVIVDPSYSITTIEADVKGPDNIGLYGVVMKATGKTSGKVYEDMTNVDGNLKKPEISPEVYDIEFELPDSDFQKLVIPNVDIHPGEHQKFSVVLHPKV
jgi:hypothetical protein